MSVLIAFISFVHVPCDSSYVPYAILDTLDDKFEMILAINILDANMQAYYLTSFKSPIMFLN